MLQNHQMFKEANLELRKMTASAKSSYYTGNITDKDSKALFKVVDGLLHRKTSVLPTSSSDQTLTDNFADYFEGKIESTRRTLEYDGDDPGEREDEELPACSSSLDRFVPVSEEEVSKIVAECPVLLVTWTQFLLSL